MTALLDHLSVFGASAGSFVANVFLTDSHIEIAVFVHRAIIVAIAFDTESAFLFAYQAILLAVFVADALWWRWNASAILTQLVGIAVFGTKALDAFLLLGIADCISFALFAGAAAYGLETMVAPTLISIFAIFVSQAIYTSPRALLAYLAGVFALFVTGAGFSTTPIAIAVLAFWAFAPVALCRRPLVPITAV